MRADRSRAEGRLAGESGGSGLERRPRPLRCLAPLALGLALAAPAAGARAADPGPAKPTARGPIDFRVFKADATVAGEWTFADPGGGGTRSLVIREATPGSRKYVGTLGAGGREAITLEPKGEGVGFAGEIRGILSGCGQDRLDVTDFLPLGDTAILRLESRPSTVPCPFLDGPPSARLYVGPTVEPIRLRALGEITSERTREQIGLAGQPGGPLTPITGDAVSIEGGTELKFLGRQRSLDGTIWIEVEGLVSPAPGIEPPRGFLAAEALRVAASLTLSRPAPAGGAIR